MLDLSNVVENNGPVPNGTYPVVVDKAEVANTKSGTGQMIKVQYKIREGAGSGRVIFDQFNIKNDNPKAVQIGLSQLKGMMKAFGHPNPNQLQSVTELLGLKGHVTTKVEEQDGYEPQARVRAYKPAGGDAPAPAADGSTTAPNANPFG